jgi:acyl carrier protein
LLSTLDKQKPPPYPHPVEDAIVRFLLKRFQSTLRRDTLDRDEPLISSGLIDSFGLLEVISVLEDTFHVTIDPSAHEPEDFDSIAKMMRVVQESAQG